MAGDEAREILGWGPGWGGRRLWLLLQVRWESSEGSELRNRPQYEPQVNRLESPGPRVMVAWRRGLAVEVARRAQSLGPAKGEWAGFAGDLRAREEWGTMPKCWPEQWAEHSWY